MFIKTTVGAIVSAAAGQSNFLELIFWIVSNSALTLRRVAHSRCFGLR